ncbi:MAG: DUF3261 domain-containing protein [Alphaproteobacteria bacterium]|nr:DUF3261 domain-containing protein [Alphaproteobacteria bacterium]
MRAVLAAAVCLLLLAACTTVRPVDGETTPLGKGLDMRLPAAPGYPGHFAASQTVVGNYGERKGAFQAVLDLGPDRAQVVLTAVSGPRILGITWTSAGIVEDRTPLAPEGLKGINVLGDIFVSLWPVEAVQRAMPDGVTVSVEGNVRRVKTADRVVEEIETTEDDGATMRQELRNLDLGYRLTIVTEKDG